MYDVFGCPIFTNTSKLSQLKSIDTRAATKICLLLTYKLFFFFDFTIRIYDFHKKKAKWNLAYFPFIFFVNFYSMAFLRFCVYI